MTKEDFFSGKSCPRNPELMRIFQDMELVERLGSGVRRILNAYAPDVFEISDTFFRVTFRYNKPFAEADDKAGEKNREKTTQITTQKTTQKILDAIRKNPQISRQELAKITGISESGVKWQLKKLKDEGIIDRVGSLKGGKWVVKNDRI